MTGETGRLTPHSLQNIAREKLRAGNYGTSWWSVNVVVSSCNVNGVAVKWAREEIIFSRINYYFWTFNPQNNF